MLKSRLDVFVESSSSTSNEWNSTTPNLLLGSDTGLAWAETVGVVDFERAAGGDSPKDNDADGS